MNAKAEIESGICGFNTTVSAQSDDNQNVTFAIDTDCEKIKIVAESIAAIFPVDAFDQINPAGSGSLASIFDTNLKGCCRGCAAPVGIFKVMQVAAGLALPKNVHIHIEKLS